MKRHRLFISILILAVLSINSCNSTINHTSSIPETGQGQAAVADLPEGWTHDVMYSNVCASPINMTATTDGSMWINDRCANRILQLGPDGTFSEWAETGEIGMDTITYQAKQNRLIGISGPRIFVIEPGSLTELGTFENGEHPVALISDSRNDHLYGVELGSNKTIKEYDQDLTFLKEIHQVSNCQNLALDSENDTLYYTEEITGTVNSIDLGTGAIKNIASGLGEGSRELNIGIAVGDHGELYFSSLVDGLLRVPDPASEIPQIQKLMDIPLGIGSIFWWSAGQAVLQTNVFAGTIIKLDVKENTVNLMEPNMNTPAISIDSTGEVFFYSQNQLNRLVNGKIEEVGKKLDTSIFSMVIDKNDNIYIPVDRFLQRVNPETGMNEKYIVFEDGNLIESILYDAKHDEIIALSKTDKIENGIAIWRVNNEAHAEPRLISLTELDNLSDSYIAVNRNTGAVYFYNQGRNTVYAVDESSGDLLPIRSDIIKPGEMPLNGFSFFTPLNGFIITVLAEGRFFIPLDGGLMERFSSMACGMDNVQGVEDANGNYLATQSGKIYLIRKCVLGEKCVDK